MSNSELFWQLILFIFSIISLVVIAFRFYKYLINPIIYGPLVLEISNFKYLTYYLENIQKLKLNNLKLVLADF